MKAEIISIGTEMTSGQNLDINSHWLSQRLAQIGIPVGFHTTVGDDFDDNRNVFGTAVGRADLVIATGGLGPTLDDLTREVLAKVGGVELVLDENSLRHIEQLFARRNRQMPERNRVQAMLPAGAEVVPNPLGTAPGIWMKIGSANIFALPGVPAEMQKMFIEQVRPRLTSLGVAGAVLVQRKINTFGAGESAVEEKLKDVTARGRIPEVGIYASDATISLRIFAQAPTPADALSQIEPLERIIRERLGKLVFGVEDEDLQDAVMGLLAQKNLSIATAESVTAGLVSHRLAQIPGASKYLRGGIVCYDSRVKIEQLGVPPEVIDKYSAVSAETAEILASNVRVKFNSDLGVSVVGYAGPEAAPDKPVGTCFAAVAWNGGSKVYSSNWGGTRTDIQSRAAKMALNAIRLHLIEC